MKHAVEFTGVGKAYGSVKALHNVSLQVDPGEVIGLLGHNGAGKTTTIKLILGIVAPSAGHVEVLGHSPRGRQAKALRLQWGYLPESVRFYEQLSGREVLSYFARLKRVDRPQSERLLEEVGLADAADRRVRTYSKGMRQRLGLAQALLGKPRLLLLDEPTAGLDPIATRDFFSTIDNLRRHGTTVILSSHVLPGIEQHVDRVAILRGGELRAWGTLDALRRDADLPLRVRVQGHWPDGFWEPRLREYGIDAYQVNGTSLEVSSRIEAKLEVMRALVQHQHVEDIEVQSPTLESLYVHYNAPRDATDA